ncbi:MAG: hypothetical protein EXQ49_09805 [Acidobacteria bacterium]|nr:hypothetical protein [Acidobacteriota bacterium]
MTRLMQTLVLGVVMMGLAGPAWAQSRPLVTEDPETVGPGQILLEAGIDYSREAFFPVSGLKGNLWRLGTLGLSFGVSSIAEIQIDGGLRNRLAITNRLAGPLSGMLDITGDSTADVEDVVVGAKVRVVSEGTGRPSLAVRFATRLPNTGNESGLGVDTTDFAFALAMGKTIQQVRVVANGGFAILGDPTRGDRQNDVFIYGLSIARAIANGAEVVAELNGRANTRTGTAIVGTESRAAMRVGSRFTRGPVRLDAAVMFGITERDPTWGVTTGLTWVFNAFTVK